MVWIRSQADSPDREFRCASRFSLLAIPLIAIDARATPLLTEVFGDHLTSTCGSPWAGDCETGWNSSAGNAKLDMCSTGSGTLNWGVGIKGGSVPNGVGQSISLASTIEHLQAKVRVTSIAGSPTMGVRLVFKDSSNTTVHVAEYATTIGVLDDAEFLLSAAKPTNATSAQVDVSVGGTVDKIGWVDSVTVESLPSTDVDTDDPVECNNAADDEEISVRSACEADGDHTWMGNCVGHIVGDVGSEFCRITCEGFCIKSIEDDEDKVCPAFD